ncbi:hypothetical protein V6N13_093821 [Hibiscus sabdariffa]|uniref:Uncharacterized protein n=1 Tax=Hibiscus sabdariffa TaxID=183260 RepID=A0ABR2NKP9_9ROSI
MAANFWQFGAISEPNRRVHEVNTVSIENRLDQLTNIISSLVAERNHSFRACGICTMTDHPTDSCPSLQDETVNAVGNFPGPPQRPYNPYSNTYNPGWRDHPNLSYAPNPKPNFQPRPPQYQPPYKSTMEALLDQLVQSQTQTNSRMQEVEKQVSLLAQTMSRLDSQIQGKLPSQTEPNLKENVSAITLRSGTIVEPSVQKQKEKPMNSDSQEGDATAEGRVPIVEPKPLNSDSQEGDDATTKEGSPTLKPEHSPYDVQPPFPSILIKEDKHAEKKEIMDVEINLPILEVIQEMPRYAHFLKKLFANTRKLFGQEKVNLREHVYAILTRQLPPKFKDQDMFAITRTIHKVSLKEVLSWTKLRCL